MKPTKKLQAIIPCRNESKTIGRLIRATSKHIEDILVVDDGSVDDTKQEAERVGAAVLRLNLPGGKGTALKAGFSESVRQGFTWALTLDGDGQHDPGDIPGFLTYLEHEHYPLVIGNRMHAPGEMPWTRRLTNRVMSSILSLTTGRALPDTQCGFRLLRLDSNFLNHLSSCHFEIESDQIAAAIHCGWDIGFMRVNSCYNASSSHIRPVVDTFRWINWLRKKHGFHVDYPT